MKIIYEQDSGIVAVMAINPVLLEQMTLQEAAGLFVPNGKRFRIVDASELPEETFWEAWQVDFTVNDGVGGRV